MCSSSYSHRTFSCPSASRSYPRSTARSPRASITPQLQPALHILRQVRKLDRVSDESRNMAEDIIFYLEGGRPGKARPA